MAENTGRGTVGLNAVGRVATGVGLGDSRPLDVRMGEADLATLWGGIPFDKFKTLSKSPYEVT
jgi:hypothetical protein